MKLGGDLYLDESDPSFRQSLQNLGHERPRLRPALIQMEDWLDCSGRPFCRENRSRTGLNPNQSGEEFIFVLQRNKFFAAISHLMNRFLFIRLITSGKTGARSQIALFDAVVFC